jgi:hypothetical protein
MAAVAYCVKLTKDQEWVGWQRYDDIHPHDLPDFVRHLLTKRNIRFLQVSWDPEDMPLELP